MQAHLNFRHACKLVGCSAMLCVIYVIFFTIDIVHLSCYIILVWRFESDLDMLANW